MIPPRMLAAALAGTLLAFAGVPQAQARILSQWVQLGPDGSASVRVITEDACPSVSFDGRGVPMSVRGHPTLVRGGPNEVHVSEHGTRSLPAPARDGVTPGEPPAGFPRKEPDPA